MSDKSRDAAKDIDTNSLIGNRYMQEIWSDGTTLWAVDYTGQDSDVGNKIYAFNLSDAAVLSSLSLSGLSLSPTFNGDTARYTGTVFGADIQTTVRVMAAQSTARGSISPADADTAAAGHQVALAGQRVETSITINVTPTNSLSRTCIVTVTNLFTARNPTQDFSTLEAAGNN